MQIITTTKCLAPLCLVLAVIAGALLTGAEPRKSSERVSVIELVATPERHSGGHIYVFGYLVDELEHHALYLTKDDAEYFNVRNGIWVELPTDSTVRRPKKGYVFVRGYFSNETNGCGHHALWRSQITNVLEVVIASK
jgi:hypothetical protein